MKIIRYKHEHETALLSAIKEDSNWDIFTNSATIDHYRKRLQESITYVCYENKVYSGYLRAITDEGLALYISELFVVPEMRNRGIGKALISRLKKDHPNLPVYALSDEDNYYDNLGFKKIGSVFEITQ